MDSFLDIPEADQWDTIEFIDKGWSDDKKYYIKTKTDEEMLLRITNLNLYQRKKKEFQIIKSLKKLHIPMSIPLSFGKTNRYVYSLFTWIDGDEAKSCMDSYSPLQQYQFGIEAGKYLQKFHTQAAPQNILSWSQRYNKKLDRNIINYLSCGTEIIGGKQMINYIKNNRYLLEDRPQCFQHGDYHVGNMIITPLQELVIIDFNRMDYGDPWEEFNRILWCVEVSPEFSSGYINSYFNNNVPEMFFKLLALYIANNQLASIPWASKFGVEEKETMLKQAQFVSESYNDFQTYIPSWYRRVR